MRASPLKYNTFIKRLKPYGIVVLEKKRGKGSERILLLPKESGSRQGVQYPIKYHGNNTEIPVGSLLAALRRFNIPPGEFFGNG